MSEPIYIPSSLHRSHQPSSLLQDTPLTITFNEPPLEEEGLLSQYEAAPSPLYSKWNILFATLGSAATISLIAIRILITFSSPINTLLMGVAGMACQFTLQNIKPIANIESHIVSDYGAEIFLTLTQIIINVPKNPIAVEVVNGILYGLFGAQVIRMIDSLFHLTIEDDRTTASSLYENTRFIKLLIGNTPFERIIQDVAKGVIAAALLTCGYTYSSNWRILAKIGWLLAGNTIGGLAYEFVHALRMYFERKYPVDKDLDIAESSTVNMHRSVYIMRMAEKISYIASIALPGIFLGVDTSPTDFVAGLMTGVKRNIDCIRFTSTPIHKMTELEHAPGAPANTLLRIKNIFQAIYHGQLPEGHLFLMTLIDVCKYLFGICGVGGFIIWNIVIGTTADRVTLGIAGALLYASYVFSRLINQVRFEENISRLSASAYFYTNYSLLPPLLYVAIVQWMNIGDIALNTYNTFKIALDILAWCSLTWGLGTLAAERASRRNRPYPAQIPPTAVLISGDWWFQNVLPPR